MAEPPQSPYKGLSPFTEADAAYYFGREHERDLIIANLMASRLTLLYGPSGVGKSSVLRAGVSHKIQSSAPVRRNPKDPVSVVVFFNSWRDDPLVELIARIQQSMSAALGISIAASDYEGLKLLEFLEKITEVHNTKLLVILDQFEEYFTYHGTADVPFKLQLSAVFSAPRLRANFLISIREDSLARLDCFKGRVPHLFDNIFRIGHLSAVAAREAIEGPIARYNQQVPPEGQVTVEPKLVDEVLTQVQAGEVALDDARGLGTVATGSAPEGGGARVETPYLQLVMSRLWKEELANGSRVLRADTLEHLGGAARIVRAHFEDAVRTLSAPQQRIAAKILRHLVTPSGTKIALAPGDLEAFTDLPQRQIVPVLDRFAASDFLILRRVQAPQNRSPHPHGPRASGNAPGDAPASGDPQYRYELEHDVLAPAILAWLRSFALLGARQKARRLTLLSILLAITVPVGYLSSADAGARFPGAPAVQRVLDDHQASVFRPVAADAEIETAAAGLRHRLAGRLLTGRQRLVEALGQRPGPSFPGKDVGWIPFSLNPSWIQEMAEAGDGKFEPWASSQSMCAVFRVPEVGTSELRPLISSLDKPFTAGPWRLRRQGTDFGWFAHPGYEYPMAEPALWTAGSVASALGRPGLLEEQERARQLSNLQTVQSLLEERYYAGSGAWNMFPRQVDPNEHSRYSSALALLVLLEMRKSGVPWRGSTATRDRLLQDTARWLQSGYVSRGRVKGWPSAGEEQRAIADGLTLQIYATLLRAQQEARIPLDGQIAKDMPEYLLRLSERSFDYRDDPGEFTIGFTLPQEDGTGVKRYPGREIIHFLWYPWGVEAAQRWLQETEHGTAPTWQRVRVKRVLGHLVLGLGEEAAREPDPGDPNLAFRVAETLYCLTSIPPPRAP